MGDLALPTAPSRGGVPWEAVLNGQVAGEALTAGMFVVLDSNGHWVKADRDSDAAYAFVTLHDASGAGSPISVMARGILGGFTGLTPGTLYYLSDTAGRVCPVADVGAGDNYVPVGMAFTDTSLLVAPFTNQLPNSAIDIAEPAQGDMLYYGEADWGNLAAGGAGQALLSGGAAANPAWGNALTKDIPASQARGDIYARGASDIIRVAASTKGYQLITGGAGADPSWAAPRMCISRGPLANIAAGTTVTRWLGTVPAGRVWVPLVLQVNNGTATLATADLQAAGSTVLAAPAGLTTDTVTQVTSFADASWAAGQPITVDLTTGADTGALNAAEILLILADLPA